MRIIPAGGVVDFARASRVITGILAARKNRIVLNR
jgi:hypothetical protein